PQPQRNALEGMAERFRFSGDVRVRFEPILQDLSPARYRARVRVRFGVDGKLGEDFTGGLYLATGTVGDDPVSTNFTESQFFSRKAIGLDRGWITYHPHAARWLELTGGKFAYTWERTPLTFDSDLNPEGFSEKVSFDFEHPFFKNLSVAGMQLWFNEAPGSTLPFALGNDSFAVGGQVGTRVRWRKGLTTNFTATALNWHNPDSIIQAFTAGTLAGNRNTNSTLGSGAAIAYASGFLYAAFQADTTVPTPWERFPARLLLNFVDNPRAASDQRHGFWGEVQFGRLHNRNDLQFGYGFARIEQDAVLAAFNESEQRAPTNVVQHRIALQWLAQKNTTASFTGWIGRTLDRSLQNAALPAGLPANRKEPYVKRLQFDLTYRF
ncbi:MAG: putative porin, partial [Terriglobales bacterium]